MKYEYNYNRNLWEIFYLDSMSRKVVVKETTHKQRAQWLTRVFNKLQPIMNWY